MDHNDHVEALFDTFVDDVAFEPIHIHKLYTDSSWAQRRNSKLVTLENYRRAQHWIMAVDLTL